MFADLEKAPIGTSAQPPIYFKEESWSKGVPRLVKQQTEEPRQQLNHRIDRSFLNRCGTTSGVSPKPLPVHHLVGHNQ